MNLYKYWLKVKTLYPMATGDCVEYFRYHYRDDWRSHFKNPDEIAAWLEKRHIHLLSRKHPQREENLYCRRQVLRGITGTCKAWFFLHLNTSPPLQVP